MWDGIATQLERIREKFARVRELDAACKLFGAASHEYRLGPPLSESDLKSIEREFGIDLPAEYRRFLAEVGCGGAGPYYGLFAPGSPDPEDLTRVTDLSKPFRWTEAFNPADLENPCAEEGVECEEDGELIGMWVPGALYICHYGCALRFFLVVNGPCRDEVWHDWQADNAGIYPAMDKSGNRLGFLAWYEEWLDQSLAAL
jgi:hypothetical protein